MVVGGGGGSDGGERSVTADAILRSAGRVDSGRDCNLLAKMGGIDRTLLMTITAEGPSAAIGPSVSVKTCGNETPRHSAGTEHRWEVGGEQPAWDRTRWGQSIPFPQCEFASKSGDGSRRRRRTTKPRIAERTRSGVLDLTVSPKSEGLVPLRRGLGGSTPAGLSRVECWHSWGSLRDPRLCCQTALR